jgi:hypothetical protein
MEKKLPESNPANSGGNEPGIDPLTRQLMEQERAYMFPDEWGLDIRPIIAKYVSPPPNIDHLGAAELRGYLRALVDVLARHHLALVSTDHLSDRELYYHILQEVIPRPIGIGPDPRGGMIYHECCPSDSEEFLMYYADDWMREAYAKEASKPLPPRRDLVADRDTWLELLAEAYRDQPFPDPDQP